MLVFFASRDGLRPPDWAHDQGIWSQPVVAFVGTGLFLKCDGDRHEETGFGCSAACGDRRLGVGSGYASEGSRSGRAGAVRSSTAVRKFQAAGSAMKVRLDLGL